MIYLSIHRAMAVIELYPLKFLIVLSFGFICNFFVFISDRISLFLY